MKPALKHIASRHEAPGSLVSYTIGFLLSILLTSLAFLAATLGSTLAFVFVIILAILQLGVQLAFFMHLGNRSMRSSAVIFALTAIIVGIVVGGSLWIMANLERLHMQMQQAPVQAIYEDGVVSPQTELK